MLLARIATHAALALAAVGLSRAADVRVDATVQADGSGPAIPSRFLGLSYETKELLPRPDGSRTFSPANENLVAVFRTLGVRSLRIGGNSVDVATVPSPSAADVDALFAFARAAGVSVIYSVRLKDGDPKAAAAIAAQIRSRHADVIDCFAIGNEPGYYKPYDVLAPRWRAIMDAIVAVVPDARFCGPDDNPNPELWRQLLRDFGAPRGPLTTLSLHSYPAGCAYQNPKPSVAIADLIPQDAARMRERLLSPEMPAAYSRIHDRLAAVIGGTRMPYRLTETNTLWYGGLQGASDSQAAALWAVEYLHWWAAHGAEGVNFHTGDRVGGGERSVVCRYAAFVSADTGYTIRPLGYAVKLFDLGGHGSPVPVTITAGPARLAAFATRTADGDVLLTLVNKTHGPDAATFDVRVPSDGRRFANARTILLRAPADDIAATSGLTLGGAPIESTGAWSGRWTSVPRSPTDDTFTAILPPASAAVVRLSVE